jgi:ABC-type nitrate/sulfonate/bicarbonate transport system ATPase subunit
MSDPTAAVVPDLEQQAIAPGDLLKLDIQDLHVSYTDKHGVSVKAVEGATMSVRNKPGVGELAVFLGPSGCGKSTILKSIAGLLQPDSGQILIDGEAPVGTGRDRGMVFQSYTSFAWLTVRKNVEYGLKLQGVPAQERKEKALAILQHVGLADFADAYPKQLSGGMKQRVAIARTLVNQPKLVLMDEPFGALDPQTRWGMQALILDVLRTQDNSVLFVTHDVSEAVFLADVVFVLSHRPTKVLHRVEIPYFANREPELRQTPEFRKVENHLLELLQTLDVKGHVQVGL